MIYTNNIAKDSKGFIKIIKLQLLRRIDLAFPLPIFP